ncbi:hypothetical protein CDL15_Pgr002255 [Punica granatum]|uniref:Uncharacterized protein n=1 Tax=Punica granatum TaxID=22663 RepID=A0A218XD74_PUNGR|nr:hypothetical protein CDL15_Pgr002255 [Punica granatum]
MESTGSRQGPNEDVYPKAHVKAFTSPLPRHLQGGVRSSELLIVSLKPGVQTGPSSLNSADRLQGGAGPASWAGRSDVWATRVGWAERARVGSQKGVLGRALELGRICGRNGSLIQGRNPRRGGTGRIVSARLGRAGWARLAQTKKMGRAREKEDAGEDEDGRRGGFQRPRTAVPTSGRRGDGFRKAREAAANTA